MKRLMLACVLGAGAILLSVGGIDRQPAAAEQGALWIPLVSALPTPTPLPAPAAVRVEPSCCQFDAPGDDNENLNEEYVCFVNQGQIAAVMDGWQVRDEADRVYIVSTFTLGPGESVKLRTGSGVNTATDLYWGLGRAVWNNDGDVVSLYDAAGILVHQYTYGLK